MKPVGTISTAVGEPAQQGSRQQSSLSTRVTKREHQAGLAGGFLGCHLVAHAFEAVGRATFDGPPMVPFEVIAAKVSGGSLLPAACHQAARVAQRLRRPGTRSLVLRRGRCLGRRKTELQAVMTATMVNTKRHARLAAADHGCSARLRLALAG